MWNWRKIEFHQSFERIVLQPQFSDANVALEGPRLQCCDLKYQINWSIAHSFISGVSTFRHSQKYYNGLILISRNIQNLMSRRQKGIKLNRLTNVDKGQNVEMIIVFINFEFWMWQKKKRPAWNNKQVCSAKQSVSDDILQQMKALNHQQWSRAYLHLPPGQHTVETK